MERAVGSERAAVRAETAVAVLVVYMEVASAAYMQWWRLPSAERR